MQDYTKLKVWEKAHKLVIMIYSATKNFPKEETYGLISQIRRASYSVPASIAEGSGKYTDADNANYLQIALGSLHETEYFSLLSKDFNYLNLQQYQELDLHIKEIKAMLVSLIKAVRSRVGPKTLTTKSHNL